MISQTPTGTPRVNESSIVMKFSTRLSGTFRADWLDWRGPYTQDTVVLLGVAVLASILAHIFDLPPKFFQLALDHANWEVDDIIFVIFIVNIAVLVCGLHRYQEARSLARHDPLTGLPNRRLFAEKLDACLRRASNTHKVAVLMLDLDGFKRINDTHGHGTGDKALCEFANRASIILRGNGVLARIGGDEFGIIMPEIGSLDAPANLAGRIARLAPE